jgi:hypothetical protein
VIDVGDDAEVADVCSIHRRLDSIPDFTGGGLVLVSGLQRGEMKLRADANRKSDYLWQKTIR